MYITEVQNNEYFYEQLSLPAADTRFLSQTRSCRICGGHSGNGAIFLQILIPPVAPYSLVLLLSTQYGLHTDSVVK
jgi:hypothetical protein